ncbi:MAG: hypothetical protein MPJ50_16750 [Pirellulales bacterium]|nr:hypothetical protein [Pirellulales bacterium]
MARTQNNRKRIFVDRSVQGALVRRVLMHWVVFFILAFLFLTAWQLLISGDPLNFSSQAIRGIWSNCIPILVTLVVLMPIFVRDTIRLSHRFSGPIVRLRNELRDLADGKVNPPVNFREGDFWQDLAGEFNRVAEVVRQNQCESSEQRALASATKASECLAETTE